MGKRSGFRTVLMLSMLLFVMSVLALGCGSDSNEGSATTDSTASETTATTVESNDGEPAPQEYSWPDQVLIVTPAVGTANHSIASAWTAEFSAATHSRARVLPASTSYARAEWLSNGDADIALMQASDYIERLNGEAGYASRTAGPTDTRVAYLSAITPWGIMVRGDSDIKTIYDVNADTRVAWYTGASFIQTGIRALLATQGLTIDDVKGVDTGSYPANSQIIVEGKADVAYTSPLSGGNYEVEANPHGIRWLNIPTAEEDSKALEAWKSLQEGYAVAPVETGVTSALGVRMSVAYQTYHVRGDEDEEFVYNLIKWWDENYDLYKDKFVHAQMMNIDNFVKFLDNDPLEPIHPGAIRYLKEKGLWKDKYQEQSDFNLALSQKYIDGFNAAMDAADEKGIIVDPDNEEWVTFWKEYRQANGLAESYGAVKRP